MSFGFISRRKKAATMSDIDNDKLGALVGKMLGDLGGAFSVPTVRIGFRLGLFDALHRHGAARISAVLNAGPRARALGGCGVVGEGLD